MEQNDYLPYLCLGRKMVEGDIPESKDGRSWSSTPIPTSVAAGRGTVTWRVVGETCGFQGEPWRGGAPPPPHSFWPLLLVDRLVSCGIMSHCSREGQSHRVPCERPQGRDLQPRGLKQGWQSSGGKEPGPHNPPQNNTNNTEQPVQPWTAQARTVA